MAVLPRVLFRRLARNRDRRPIRHRANTSASKPSAATPGFRAARMYRGDSDASISANSSACPFKKLSIRFLTSFIFFSCAL